VNQSKISRNPVRLGLWAYVLTLILVLVVAGANAGISGLTLSAFGATVRDGAIVSGFLWVLAAFLLGGSTHTYLGAGGMGGRTPPILWPSDALPMRSEAVLKDLKFKLADPQSLTILFVILGVSAVAMGFIAFASAISGVVAISIVAAALAVLLLATRAKALPRLSESSRS
jgi:hypothetical protein